MSWSITQGLTVVNLPQPPDEVDDSAPVQIDAFDSDGNGEVLISRFPKARQLTLKGSIFVKGQNNGYLETTYLAPLRGMRRQAVSISDPDSQFSGTWLMKDPVFHRSKDNVDPVVYTFVIVFVQGVDYVVF